MQNTRTLARNGFSLGKLVARVTCVCLLAWAGRTATLAAQNPPVLVSVTPADGAIQVPTTSSLVFVFDQAMDTTVPVIPSTSGFTGSFDLKAPGFNQTLTGTWGSDERTLTIKPFIQFPYATFTWTLNPTGPLAFFRLKSKAGVELAAVSGTFTTGVGGTDPKLGSTVPADGTFAVPLDQVVTFKFDSVMKKTAISAATGTILWTGNGIDPTKFIYTWSADGRSLGCDYPTNFPKTTPISWVLNPASASVKLESESGRPLAVGTYSGQFTTGSTDPGCSPDGLPLSWGTYSLYKRLNYRQESAATPLPDTDTAVFVFSAVVSSGASAQTITSGSLTRPDQTVDPLVGLGGTSQFFETFQTEAALDADFPAGLYTLKFNRTGESAERVIEMNLPATPPPIPAIQNFAEAQAINPTADFTLRWNAFTGAGANDHISIYVTDDLGHVLFQAPDFCAGRTLAASATSAVIPANSLPPNSTLSVGLLFGRLFYYSTNTVPLMSGFGDLIRNTYFDIKTTGGGGNPGPAIAATLSEYRVLPNGNPQFKIAGTASRAYFVQRTGNIATPSWAEIATVTLDAAGSILYEDPQAGKTFPLYYRVGAR